MGLLLIGMAAGRASDFSEPWRRLDRAIVIDAYEYNSIEWKRLVWDKRIVGFINKGSDGLPPPYRCSGNKTEVRLCRALWKRYAVARELYHTRRTIAKSLGLKWGAYHLGRPGNPVRQAEHFINFAEPGPDDLIAIDIEEDDPEKWMSLADAEIFARHIHKRLGRYPVLYTNGVTSRRIATLRDRYPLLSRLPLWYARYKPEIGEHFPKGHWTGYALWQFTSHINCDEKSCPYRVTGTPLDIDVNVAAMSVHDLRKAWPFGGLVEKTSDMALASVPLPILRELGMNGHMPLRYVPVAAEEPATVDEGPRLIAEPDMQTGEAEIQTAALVEAAPVATAQAVAAPAVADDAQAEAAKPSPDKLLPNLALAYLEAGNRHAGAIALADFENRKLRRANRAISRALDDFAGSSGPERTTTVLASLSAGSQHCGDDPFPAAFRQEARCASASPVVRPQLHGTPATPACRLRLPVCSAWLDRMF